MESQPQNPEFMNNPESFHPCLKEYLYLSDQAQSIWADPPEGRGRRVQDPPGKSPVAICSHEILVWTLFQRRFILPFVKYIDD